MNYASKNRFARYALALAASLALGGCALTPFEAVRLEADQAQYHPGVSPQPNWSALDSTMQCLGDRLRQARIQPVAFGFSGTDTSGKTGVSVDMLLSSALNRIAARGSNLEVASVSNVPRPDPVSQSWLENSIATREARWLEVRQPDWIIIGGVTSAQSAARLEQDSGGLSATDGDIGGSRTRIADIVNLSLTLLSYRKMTSSGAQIDLRVRYQTMRAGVDGGLYIAGSLNGKPRSAGLRLGREVSVSQNPEDALRAGVDYGVTVLLAEHFGVDLTACPGHRHNERPGPDGTPMLQALPEQYERMTESERTSWVQASLAAIGYLQGEIDTREREVTRNAILRYERDTGMPRDGRVTQRLYLRLAEARLARGEDVRKHPEPSKVVPPVALMPSSPNAPYRRGDVLRMRVLPPVAGHLICYLQGPSGVFRIHPMRRREGSFVSARAPTHLPDPNEVGPHPRVALTNLGLHSVWCGLSSRDVRPDLPLVLRVGSNPLAAGSLNQVRELVKTAAGRLWITEGSTAFRVKEQKKPPGGKKGQSDDGKAAQEEKER